MSPAKLAGIKGGEGIGSLFTGGIEENLKKDLKFFEQQTINALSHPLQKTKHEMPPSFDKNSFPRKSLIEAFYYDSKRLNVDDVFSRVIIFSDMIENSDLLALGSMSPLEDAVKVAKRFPMFLNFASFQIYGINYTNTETKINEDLRDFWKQYLLLSGAYVEQYGAQLAVSEDTDRWDFYKYKGHVTASNVKGAASFRMVIGDDGKIRHGWLEMVNYYLPLSGEVSCNGQNCTVDAQIVASVNLDSFKPKDVLKLKGNMSKFNGIVGGKDESVIDDQGKIYQLPVSFIQF
jgi:hypothetical protein